MSSTITRAGSVKSACRLLALAALLFASGSAFAQSTNVLTNAAANLQAALGGGGTVILNFNGTVTANGPYYISKNAILDGSTNNVTISGAGSTVIFEIASNVTFEVRNLTISGGKNTGVNGVNGNVGSNGGNSGGNGGNATGGQNVHGGAVYNMGTARFINCFFLTNTVVGGTGGNGGGGGNGLYYGGNGGNGGNGGAAGGGAIYNLNTLLLSNCTFTGNSAVGGAGGLGGTNGTPTAGGKGYSGWGGYGGAAAGAAVYNVANMTILACTFAGNYSVGGSSQAATSAPNNQNGQQGYTGANGYGGGIYNSSSDTIVNSTFYGNLAVGGNGGNGGNAAPSGFFQGPGGNGGNALGGSIYNDSTGYTVVTNCTFEGGQTIGGTNGVNGSGPEVHGTGSPGLGYGANIYNNSGTFLL